MRHLLGTVLLSCVLALGLAGCGDDESGSVSDDPAPTASSSPTERQDPGDQGVDFDLVAMVTETGAGGETGPPAVPLSDTESVQEFTAQFETEAMGTKLQDAVEGTEIPDGMLLYGAVVAIGCDVPTDVTVTAGDSGLVITAVKVPSPQMECFAAMTTVALVLVPADAVS